VGNDVAAQYIRNAVQPAYSLDVRPRVRSGTQVSFNVT
jgi:hypothetical protein